MAGLPVLTACFSMDPHLVTGETCREIVQILRLIAKMQGSKLTGQQQGSCRALRRKDTLRRGCSMRQLGFQINDLFAENIQLGFLTQIVNALPAAGAEHCWYTTKSVRTLPQGRETAVLRLLNV